MSAFSAKNSSTNILAEFGSHKIKKGMVVFTIGNSKEVLDILLTAKKRGINFEVSVTETRPEFTGRKTAQKLAKSGIHVSYYADSETSAAIKKADLVLLGSDAITKDGTIYAGIGSEQVAELASSHDVPVYFCMLSKNFWHEAAKKYEKSKELGKSGKLWGINTKKIRVLNYQFEKIHPKQATGIISNLGILKIHHFISEAERNKK